MPVVDVLDFLRDLINFHSMFRVDKAGERHKYDAPVCSIVLKQLKAIETNLFPELVHIASSTRANAQATDGNSDISGTGDDIHTSSGPAVHSSSSPNRKTVAGSIAGSYNSSDHITALMAALMEVDGARPGRSVFEGHPTLGEWWFWISRLLALVGSIVLVLFLFLHDY